MRLREVQQILLENIPYLQIKQTATSTSTPQGNAVMLSALRNVRRAILAIAAVPSFAPLIDRLRQRRVLWDYDESVAQPPGDANTLVNEVVELARQAQSMLELLNLALPSQDPNTVVVELPAPGSLDRLKARIELLDKWLHQVVEIRTKGSDEPPTSTPITEVQNFDSGSFWIELKLPDPTTLAVLGLIVSAALRYTDRIIQMLRDVEMLRAMKFANDDVKSALEHQRKLRSAHARALAEDIRKKALPKADPQTIRLVEHAIRSNSKMIRDNVKLLVGATASTEAKKIFPEVEEFKKLAAPQLQLPPSEQAETELDKADLDMFDDDTEGSGEGSASG